ncbi:mobilization protein [Dyadobacter endophyticus]|uniref:Mobilization protein n=1 Tax=Dyadobacter endophyticus TaxID=1749036 RepID=A0ABQ1ZC01_9BACT|nr:MobC family plasmid mobilization relaxosome protein [Dyadobacter endophyticus]GGH55801.1 mobilization protein [Dyadobacter endophyticus]
MSIERQKAGRPKKSAEHKKSERIVFWTTPAKAKEIEERAGKFSLTVSEYCSKIILEVEIVAPFTEEELDLKRSLIGMANNLNQIAYRANAGGIESVAQSATELLGEIKRELKKFKE